MNNLIADMIKESKAEHEAALDKLKELNSKKEWLNKRRGRFTASNFHRLMGYEDKAEFPKGAETYAMECAVESLTTESDSYTNDSMERGNEKEIEGVIRFMEITGLKVEKYGNDQEFVELGKDVGATPDGIINPDGGVEGKAPNSKTHFFYLTNIKNAEDLKKHCKDYYYQCQGGMYVTGAKFWYWFSFDDRFARPEHQMLIIRIERNEEDITKLKNRLIQAVAFKNKILKQL